MLRKVHYIRRGVRLILFILNIGLLCNVYGVEKTKLNNPGQTLLHFLISTDFLKLSHTLNKSVTSAVLEVVQIHPHLTGCHMDLGDCHRDCHRAQEVNGQGHQCHCSW